MSKLRKALSALKHTHWTVAVVGLAAVIAGLTGYPEQNCEDICTGSVKEGMNFSSVTCVALGSMMLTYWLTMTGHRHLWHGLKWLGKWIAAKIGIPTEVFDLLARGAKLVLTRIKERAMEMVREEGREEGREEVRQEANRKAQAFQSWIRRQREAGNLTIDESDPPPQ